MRFALDKDDKLKFTEKHCVSVLLGWFKLRGIDMKRILCFLLAAIMLVSLASCAETDNTESKTESTEESKQPPKRPVINGIDLSEFTVVYKKNSDAAQFKTVALEFIEYVKSNFGIELDYRSDLVPQKGNEIIFGSTERREACADMISDYGFGGYKLAIKENTVVVASSYATGCYAGYKELINMIEESKDGIFTDCEKSGEAKVIKVACVGDSITQGINSADPTKTYPNYLQNMLGLEYYVLNAGLSGYSIVSTDEYAYCKSQQYVDAKALKADVVIFNLGTNDANPTPTQPYKNWDNAANDRENKFIQSTKDLLDSFKAANPDCQIYICLPSSLFAVAGDQWGAEAWTANIVKHSHPLLKQIANDYGYPTIDLFDWSKEHSEVFTDGLHPKDETYEVYAKYIYDSIKETIKKS